MSTEGSPKDYLRARSRFSVGSLGILALERASFPEAGPEASEAGPPVGEPPVGEPHGAAFAAPCRQVSDGPQRGWGPRFSAASGNFGPLAGFAARPKDQE